jgi:soluble lytic murein transglycosylase-like protein
MANLVASVVTTESHWNPKARSPVGAIGLGQLMPATAKSLGVDPSNPHENLRGTTRYLASNLKRFKSIPLAAAGYNAGPGAVSKHGGIPPFKETKEYVKRVCSRMECNQ